MFRISNSLNLEQLVVNEPTKSISKKIYQYFFFYPIDHSLLQRFQDLVTKEQDNVSHILISITFHQSRTTSCRVLGVRGVEMKILERVKK